MNAAWNPLQQLAAVVAKVSARDASLFERDMFLAAYVEAHRSRPRPDTGAHGLGCSQGLEAIRAAQEGRPYVPRLPGTEDDLSCPCCWQGAVATIVSSAPEWAQGEAVQFERSWRVVRHGLRVADRYGRRAARKLDAVVEKANQAAAERHAHAVADAVEGRAGDAV